MGATPTMDGVALGSPRSTETSNYSALMWEQTLIDHLLNFAGTPKVGYFDLQLFNQVFMCSKQFAKSFKP